MIFFFLRTELANEYQYVSNYIYSSAVLSCGTGTQVQHAMSSVRQVQHAMSSVRVPRVLSGNVPELARLSRGGYLEGLPELRPKGPQPLTTQLAM